jgi:hypothetical protein
VYAIVGLQSNGFSRIQTIAVTTVVAVWTNGKGRYRYRVGRQLFSHVTLTVLVLVLVLLGGGLLLLQLLLQLLVLQKLLMLLGQNVIAPRRGPLGRVR